jgi:hypothetical protein
VRRYEVLYTLHMQGTLVVEAESAKAARDEVEGMTINELEDGHHLHEVEIESVEETDEEAAP